MHQLLPVKVLEISARSDVGGGPAHMYELALGVSQCLEVNAALPRDGHFYRQFQGLIGPQNVVEIPRQKFTLRAFIELRSFCKQQRINLIHSHGKGAGVYSRLLGLILGLPVVHTLHGYHDGRYSSWLKWVYALWETFAGLVTRKIICVSSSEAQLFGKKVQVSEEKLVVIPNGTKVPLANMVDPVAKKVVTVARFDYQKNLLELLRVAQLSPDHNFYIIGDGADRREIEKQVAEQNINNVTLCGVSHQVMEDISDAEVYLTTARWEGLPLAVLEAMSLGIPVVASDVVGNRDAVAEGVTGYLYPLGDISACIRAIEQAKLLDRSQIRRFHSENYSSERMIASTLDLYQSVLEGRPA